MDEAETLRLKLGLPAAPLVQQGLRKTCDFFHAQLNADPVHWWEYLRGIDFHKPVWIELLHAGTRLSQHQTLGPARAKPFAYFTVPGTSPTSTGTSFDQVRYREFRTTRPVNALVSAASPMAFNNVQAGVFDRVSRTGGGRQYILAVSDLPVSHR